MPIVTSVRTIARSWSLPATLTYCLLFSMAVETPFGIHPAQAAVQDSEPLAPPSANRLQPARFQMALPSSSNNGALHYQRALLFLAAVEDKQQQLLNKPIWEIVNTDTTAEEIAAINNLLIASRHAIRSALIGAAQMQADFGTDLRQYAATTRLPHVIPMSHLAKLVALHGMQRQAIGNWREAAQIYLDVVRMGRHMSQQLTLAESIEAVRILETGFHVLADWAVRCPNTGLIGQVRAQLGAIMPYSISPAAAISREARFVQLGLTDLQHAYPDGNWAEMILVAMDAKTSSLSPTEMRAAARTIALKRGIPKSVFDNKESFDQYVGKKRAVNRQYYQELLACLTLPASAAVREGARIQGKYAAKLKRLGNPKILNAGQIAAYFAAHQAEHRLTRVVLALSAHKQEGRFPKDLSSVAADFGGQLPDNPYGEGPPDYALLKEGTGMRIGYPQATIGDVVIPKVAFEYAGSTAD